MPQDRIVVHGAREHNLKNVDIEIPRDKLVVITGLSGSGKSSLAFDTIYAEGQRRYVESLSAYARQFLGQMDKPDVDRIDGLSPAISIDQKGVSNNPRSTVGTVTEIWDYMRLLWARAGTPHCPNCGRPVRQQTVEQIVDSILSLPDGSRIQILGPVIRDRKGEHLGVFEDARKGGYVRARVNGTVYDLAEVPELEKYKQHSIEIVVDRLIIRHADEHPHPDRVRIADSVETALKLGGGVVIVNTGETDTLYSERFACVYCNISLGEIEPRTFSFNSPHGACPTCAGLGTQLVVDPELVVPNPDLSLHDGAVAPWAAASTGGTYYAQLLESVAEHYGFSTRVPWRELTREQQAIVLNGTKERIKLMHRNKQGQTREYSTQFEGAVTNLARRFKESESEFAKLEIEKYMTQRPCPTCAGARLKPEARAVTLAGDNIVEVSAKSIGDSLVWFRALSDQLTERERAIARLVIREIVARLSFLVDVGLDYLTLFRTAATLSGGEAQRIRLATQIGSSLMGVLYILDEPSIGLHQRDNQRLIATLERLRDIGNTVLVVEHDEDTMRAADHIIDIGPGAGVHGGRVVAQGTLQDIIRSKESITGAYLRGERGIRVPPRRRPGNGKQLVIKGARENNLKHVDVAFPLGKFIAVTGVSGSGKSTLVNEILYRRLAQAIYRSKERPGKHDAVVGLDQLDKVVDIDQSPIGRTPRSNPATYTGVFTPIRELFASTPEAAIRGYAAGRFSFNVKGGRCEACQGEGIIKIEMQFLPDVYVPCEVCKGKRYNREALEIKYRDRTISDVLDMTVAEACQFFEAIPSIKNKLQTIDDVGLGYIKLGQPATTLSGGEAQRVKLATELSKRATGRTMYILDEPTTGLHFADVERLLHVLQRLVDAGNSIVVIEHNLDVIKCADWLIDLGPEGGVRGGYIIAEGTPEQIADTPESHTGQFLARILGVPASQSA